MLEDKKIIVTGGAGFIGSHLVDRLVEDNNVTVIDNLSTGYKDFLNPDAEFIKGSVLDLELDEIFQDVDLVFHLAANPEVKNTDPENHIRENFLGTYEVLEIMRKCGVNEIVFTSSSTVYGEAEMPTNVNHPTFPISLYGAMKLSSEGLISSYCHTFDFEGWVFRFANVVGSRLRHGVTYDFINKLKKNPEKLKILGNGEQEKSYIYIEDCIEAMIYGIGVRKGFDVFNIGTEDQVKVKEIAEIVSDEMNLNPEFEYTGGERGWKGDVPKMLLSSEKLKKLGWEPEHNSEDAVRKATKELLKEV